MLGTASAPARTRRRPELEQQQGCRRSPQEEPPELLLPRARHGPHAPPQPDPPEFGAVELEVGELDAAELRAEAEACTSREEREPHAARRVNARTPPPRATTTGRSSRPEETTSASRGRRGEAPPRVAAAALPSAGAGWSSHGRVQAGSSAKEGARGGAKRQ